MSSISGGVRPPTVPAWLTRYCAWPAAVPFPDFGLANPYPSTGRPAALAPARSPA